MARTGPAAAVGPCFAPVPGHPTSAEKQAFLDEMRPLAADAERRYGVPAAAIVAIAVQESGYGWTRLAQDTNNLMAWKYNPGTDTGGRRVWSLECPELKSTDEYLVFNDPSDAVDFVARHLASSDNYGDDTERYRRDRASGVDVAEAVDRWVDGIADPYSSNPDQYRRSLRRVLNDPLNPTERRSPERNLYQLSSGIRASAR